uniref:NifU_N domain-containing protein n=1 Tax=Heterorhabditis bacteriophora TaxID=37862 RepID=A0A1I7X8P5_HETBA
MGSCSSCLRMMLDAESDVKIHGNLKYLEKKLLY